ncbi:MAG: ParA family protein [Hyphomicrobiaceae bacterium]|nr:MAG: ParA family protein [Hyphomicrobiaceae bacterium]
MSRTGKMNKTRIIAVVNRKGGVAKTTTTTNLAWKIAETIRDRREIPEPQKNDRVLIIDLDPQSNVAAALGIDPNGRCLGRFLLGETKFSETIVSADRGHEDSGLARPNLFVVPSSDQLQERLRELDVKLYFQQQGRKYAGPTMSNILSYSLGQYAGHFRYILIDCPPTLGHLDTAVYDFAHEVIVPVKMAYLDSAGAMQHLKDLREAQTEMGAKARLTWIVPTFYRPQEVLARQMLENITKVYRNLVAVPIPQSVTVEKSQAAFQRTLFEFDPESPATLAYASLAERVMAQ